MSVYLDDHQELDWLGPGDVLLGNHCVVKGGHGYTARGNHNRLHGVALTVEGDDLYVEGSDSVITGTQIVVKGPRQHAAGMMIHHLGEESDHAAAVAPPDAPKRPEKVVITRGATIGQLGGVNRGTIVVGAGGAPGPVTLGGGKYRFEKGVVVKSGVVGSGTTVVTPTPPTPSAVNIGVVGEQRGGAVAVGDGAAVVMTQDPTLHQALLAQLFRGDLLRDVASFAAKVSPARKAPAAPRGRKRPAPKAGAAPKETKQPPKKRAKKEAAAPPPPMYPPLSAAGDPVAPEDGRLLACVICADHVVNSVALECGHMYSCICCLHEAKPTVCAICQRPVTRFVRTFESGAADM